MASFPTSVYSPASKSAGQTITASFFNDPEAEITAIESGYLNGTARLNSSNSTVTNLTVTGGSTFAVRPVEPPPDAVRLQLDATQQIALNSTSALSWSSQVFMTNASLHSTTTNPTRITPQSTGLYLCRAQFRGQNAASSGALVLFVEDSSGGAFGLGRAPGSSGIFTVVAQGIKRFDVTGGYVRVVVVDASATNSAAIAETWFEMVKL